ncbi:MAG TPA: carbon-nitrogen hydrolase family protein [Fimbriimonadales bacterium]|nr:carbon-nitrogen hydrolase family protein [Fimbriimonadales bacterium]
MIVSVVQFFPKFSRVQDNTERVIDGIRYAKKEGAKLVVYPECALTGYCFSSEEEAKEAAISLSSEPIRSIEEICKELGVVAVVGFAEKRDANLHNSAAVFTPEGLKGVYRKTHLPFLGLDRFVKAGDELKAFETSVVKIGVLICYDIRIPEAVRVLSLQGAEIVVLPTNWPEGASAASDIICPARAIENGIFVATSNRVGEEKGFRFIGKSKIIAPNGDVLASAEHANEETIFAEVDVAKARNKHVVRIPGEYEYDLFASRLPDLYGDLVKKSE